MLHMTRDILFDSAYKPTRGPELWRALESHLSINILYIDYIDTRNECAVISNVQVRYNVREHHVQTQNSWTVRYSCKLNNQK
jgi:hypothetical protein